MASINITNSGSIKPENWSSAGLGLFGTSMNVVTYRLTNLKPDSYYDVYLNGKIYNRGVRQIGHSYWRSWDEKDVTDWSDEYWQNADKTVLKSDSRGRLNFDFYPLFWWLNLKDKNGNIIWGDRGENIVVELRGPDKVKAASSVLPSIPPSNPIITAAPTKITGLVGPEKPQVTTEYSRTEYSYGKNNKSTPLSEVSLFFDYIQSFYIDPKAFGGSQTVALSHIELFFKSKPDRKHNQSKIVSPGVEIFICKMKSGGKEPDLSKVYTESLCRNSYNDVTPSLSSNVPTVFQFDSPLTLKTGEYYGIVINFEDPDYVLWVAKQGAKQVGSSKTYASGYSGGKLFRASNYKEIDKDPKTVDIPYKALSDLDLKFYVNILEFTSTQKNIELVNRNYEFIVYDNLTPYSKSKYKTFLPFEAVWQDFGNTAGNVTYYKDGTIDATDVDHIVADDPEDDEYIFRGTNTKFLSELEYKDHIAITDGTPGNTIIRRVLRVDNDNQVRLSNGPGHLKSTAAFYKVVPLAGMQDILANPNMLVCRWSSAREKSFFIKDGINYITFTSGSGYANGDYIIFTGGTKPGKATITTNSIGHISKINIVNTGYGFTSSPSPTVTVYTSTGAIRTGSSTITAYPGAQIKGSWSKAKAEIKDIAALDVNTIIPDVHFDVKGGEVTSTKITFASYNNSTDSYGISSSNYFDISKSGKADITSYDAKILSKSLEILNAATLSPSISEGKSSVIKFTIKSSNKYESPELHVDLSAIYTFTNIINNDTYGENTNSGNAASKHISKKITFDKNKFAEDITLITSVWRPPGTNIKFYAKIHNSKDEDAFDDKDWTELELKDTTFDGRIYSSASNPKDFVELTYGFRRYPKISLVADGSAYLANASIGNTTVTGPADSNPSFNTQIANGDVIVLYNSLFPNTNYAVAVVANTPTVTSFEISNPIDNAAFAATSLRIGVVAEQDKYSAFNNIQNDNVVRYYSSSLTEYDTYDTMSIKIVPLSTTTSLVPRVDDVRVIGVSA